MAKQSIEQLKQWFETGDIPTQSQFWDWLDSFIHKDEQLTVGNVQNLSTILSQKADSSALQLVTPVLLPVNTTQWVAPIGTLIEGIIFLTTGTKNIKVGTSPGGEEIVFLQEINSKAIFRPDFICDTETTIYFSGVGSNTIIKILRR